MRVPRRANEIACWHVAGLAPSYRPRTARRAPAEKVLRIRDRYDFLNREGAVSAASRNLRAAWSSRSLSASNRSARALPAASILSRVISMRV